MLYKIDNTQIGKYISGLIEQTYKSSRQFCIAYLKLSNNNSPTEDEIRNMANRLSQIKKGVKSIQIYDLPFFSQLLDVSYEQILSGGKCSNVSKIRLTNYSVSQSHDKADWITYINDKNKPMANPDEYGKTVLDYAITFGNYEFIKFLIDEKYIWFDSKEEKDYVLTFGAGTAIQQVTPKKQDGNDFVRISNKKDLEYSLKTNDNLRINIISLAADYKDISVLEKLRARELPELYYKAHYLSCSWPDFNIHYNKNMVTHIAKSSDNVLDYFTEPFEVRDYVKYKDGNIKKHTFVFPYISQLLDLMIENNSTYLKTALEKLIQYNENVLEKLQALIKQSIISGCYSNDNWNKEVYFHDNGNIIHFRDRLSGNGIITNIIKVTKKSGNTEIDKLVDQLNSSYSNIKHMAGNRTK